MSQPIIYLIRHGEKPPKDKNGDDPIGLSTIGQTRADALPSVFSAGSGYDIAYILAEKPKKDGSRTRPLETITPLAESLGLKPDASIDRDDASGVADAAKSFKGPGNVLICWEHGQLEDIAKEIGVKRYAEGSGWTGKVKYPGDRFDLIWEVKSPWKEVSEVKSEKVKGLDDKVVADGNGRVVQNSDA